MEINWDSIRYFFQIPREWFRYIHRKIHNAYGTLFIRVMDGEYGGMKIDIDKAMFKEAVEDVAGLNEYVKSVDDVTPDENGNVKLEGYVKSVSDIKPDENGNVNLGENFLEPSDITTVGIVVGTDYKGEHTVCSPNHKHNVKDVDGSIKTVNGNSPDKNGNVVIPSVLKVNDILPDDTGNVDLGVLVKSVNDHQPDENGKISFSVVEKVDGVEPVNGNVPLGAIRSINNTIRPVNGNVDLTGVFAPLEHTHPHTQISDWSQATKDFLKATELTSPGIVVGTDYDDADHPVCSPNHKHNAKDIVNDDTNGFVTIDTEQKVSGRKLFTSTLDVANNSVTTGVQLQPGGVVLVRGDNPGLSLTLPNSNREEIGHFGYTASANTLQLISMKYGFAIGNANDNNNEVVIGAQQNKAKLTNSPSTDGTAPDLAIATVGWVKEKAITVPDGKELKTQNITVVTNVTWNGTQIVVEKKNLEFTNGVLTDWGYVSSSKINTVAYNAN